MKEQSKAVFMMSDWPEEPEGEILVTYVQRDESESDAILRAMELYSPNYSYYIKDV